MGEMIERVAKAMENRAEVAGVSIHAAALSDEDWLELARAAMEVMSHPSEEMTAVANAMEANYKAQLKSFEVTGFCWLIYRAMILKALEP